MEDNFKTIYQVQHQQGRAGTSASAERLGVAPASVTSMFKRLNAMYLANYDPYRGVVLTQAGQRTALELIRRHRLIENYLTQVRDVPWDQVHAEADR